MADLVWQHSLAHRIHCLWYGDLTHDGLSELAIVSTGGIHILQVSPRVCTLRGDILCKYHFALPSQIFYWMFVYYNFTN